MINEVNELKTLFFNILLYLNNMKLVKTVLTILNEANKSRGRYVYLCNTRCVVHVKEGHGVRLMKKAREIKMAQFDRS